MREEEETARLNLERETQNVIEQDQKNNQIRLQIQEQEEEIEELDIKNRLLDKRLEGLRECECRRSQRFGKVNQGFQKRN